MTADPMPLALRLAAIITLLSSSVLRGLGPGKTEALRAHLEAAVIEAVGTNDPILHATLEEVLTAWKMVSCPICDDSWASLPVSQICH